MFGNSQYTTGPGRTAGQYNFSKLPSVEIPRSVFDRSCGLKTAFDAGDLVPIFVDEALPGDTINLSASAFGRLQPLLDVPFENMFMDFFFFAVPIRLVWDDFEKFQGAQDNPGDSISFVVPTMTETPAVGSLSDYMGIPIGNSLTFSSLWHRAYNLIFNEFFRDQDLTNSAVVDKDAGPDTPGDYVIRKRTKRRDYFSACRPSPQKGNAVSLPLGTTAPVVAEGSGEPQWTDGTKTDIALAGGATADAQFQYSGGGGVAGVRLTWSDTALEADLSAATAATINDIRLAFQTQRLLEKDARGGTRYSEIVRNHFGVVNPDARWRPEYLGGGSSTVIVNPIPRTDGFVGAQGAFGTVAGGGIGFVKSFTEHNLILGLVNVRADITYQQGLPRMFSRSTRYDFYMPVLAHLGEQAVLSKEIFADGSANDEDVFGYQERWAEYRYKPSQITGQLRSTATTPLDTWHLALEFASRPTLNNTFIEDQPPLDRIVSITTEPEFFLDCWFNFKHARPMPTYSVPGLIDHF